ncbi:MAG: NYN domain-containing protein [Balneolaceae bacterium]|nr:NYN domain-containing protein [Balneolaceae bacterium]
MGIETKVGVYVDAINVTMNGGYGLRYDILRKFACRNDAQPNRMNVYLAYDERRAKEDSSYRSKTTRFCEVLRDFEYKVIEKPVHYYRDDETGETITKSTVAMDMAVDMITQADDHHKIVLLTSDGSYVSVVNAVQEKGCRVELIGFDNVSSALRREVDLFMSGYLIPGLLPIDSPYDWGEVGSRVRGVCYDFSHNDGYGFMRYLKNVNDKLWVTDSRFEESPYRTVFAHISQFEEDFDTSYLPSRDLIFAFDLEENEKGLIAKDIELVSAP